MATQGRRGNVRVVFSNCRVITYIVSLKARLPPEVNRVLYVRNLPFKISAEEMYDIFGKYGPIRQIRLCVNILSLS
jgi:RNA recognition motif-containing protein